MKFDADKLPDNVNALKTMLVSQQFDIEEYQKDLSEKTRELIAKDETISYLEEQRDLFKKLFLGKKSEKLTQIELNQLYLFNEIEETVKESAKETTTVSAYSRKKRGCRQKLPDDLPRKDIILKLSEKDRIHGCGKKMKEIGQVVSEKLTIIPERVIVLRYIRSKYACECEGVDTEGTEGAVRITPMPKQLIPKSMATPGLLSYILTRKFEDALPFYRQEKIFKRIGIDLPRQTLCRWAKAVHKKCQPILELMKTDIRSGPLISIDETPVRVLKDKNKEPVKSKNYMWVSRGGIPDKTVLWYEHHPQRSTKYIQEFLKDYKGYVQCDGYSAYNVLEGQSGIELAGCWAHARRRFARVKELTNNKASALQGFKYIQDLYHIEHEGKNLSPDARKELRQEKSAPILKDFRTWLEKTTIHVPPKSLMGEAVNYTLKQWDKLITYLKDGRIPIDNNLTENAIRPFVVGRKNWLFSATESGAEASAAIFSLIETAKANNIEPYWYLLYLFEKLPDAQTERDFKVLLPYNVDKKKLKSYL